MSPDIKYLVWMVALVAVQVLIATVGGITQVGMPTMVGNREPAPEFSGWVGRAVRAHRNTLESLVLFAILVLAAAVTNRANAMTALGAALFFWARVAHAVIYLAGIAWLRTIAWSVSVAGLALIFLQLI